MKRINRVRKHQEFSSIIHESHSVKSKHFSIYYHVKEEPLTRIGISVSKKNGGATIRTLIKRQVRAMIGANYNLNLPYDIVIIVRTNYQTDEFASNTKELIENLGKIGEQGSEKIKQN